MKSQILVLFTFGLILITFISCDKDDDNNSGSNVITGSTELTDELNQIYDDSNAPGFAISVVKNNVILYQKAFGKADIDNDKAYSNQTNSSTPNVNCELKYFFI